MLKAEAMAVYLLRHRSTLAREPLRQFLTPDYSQVIEKHVEQDIQQCDELVTYYYWTTRMSIGPA